jgi:uncharacterized protein YceH (UPF0502 family)
MSARSPAFTGHLALSHTEIRVLGCLLEKQRTTPDTYPLSLNGLRLACNQSTNRDPVVQYDDALLRDALHGLERRGLARLASGAGSRAAKYRHLLDDKLPLSGEERAIMTTLMLRGPQTPGELKQRGERMYSFADLAAVQRVLDALIERGLAQRLPRRPGQKEERYAQQLGEDANGEVEAGIAAVDGAHAKSPQRYESVSGATNGELEQRVARLEREVADLRAQLAPAEVPATAPEVAPPASVDFGEAR